MRNAFATVIVLAVIVLSALELDRPTSPSTTQASGTVGNISVHARPDGMVEQRMEVTLDDGRKVMASALRPMQVVQSPFRNKGAAESEPK